MKNSKHVRKTAPRFRRKSICALVAVVLLVTVVVGGTIAYLMAKSEPVQNIFEPTEVTCYVAETFDGATKTNVRIQNTGNTSAYIRVAIAANNVNAEGKICGLHPANPTFTLGANWVKYGNYYYYTLPVAPTEYTGIFTDKIQLTATDCCQMRVEIVSSAVQSAPASAVGEAWHVSIAPGSVTAYSAG